LNLLRICFFMITLLKRVGGSACINCYPDFHFHLVLFVKLCYNENDKYHPQADCQVRIACRTADAGEWYHFIGSNQKER